MKYILLRDHSHIRLTSKLSTTLAYNSITPAQKAFDKLFNDQFNPTSYWLTKKYHGLDHQDALDIVIESSQELWIYLQNKPGLTYNEQVALFKIFARNKCTHWFEKYKDSGSNNVEWKDEKFDTCENEVEYGTYYVTEDTAHKILKEIMYDDISHLSESDQKIINLYLQKVSMEEIARQVGLKDAKSAKTRKYKIVIKLRKNLDGQAFACPSFFGHHCNEKKAIMQVA